jgi:potassium channel subfamily K, other eukaryote
LNTLVLFQISKIEYSIDIAFTNSCQLIAITACMQIYTPPNRPYETYTQGYWYAISAAAIYLVCSMILMVNMLGYFLGRYPDHFALTDAQRTLILQTMLFFIWLAGGAGIFSRIETDAGEQGWAFADAVRNFSLVLCR